VPWIWQSTGLLNIMDLVSRRNNFHEKTDMGMGFAVYSIAVHINLNHKTSYRCIRRLFTTFDTDSRPGVAGL